MEIVANIVVIGISLSPQFAPLVHSFNDDPLNKNYYEFKKQNCCREGKKKGGGKIETKDGKIREAPQS